MSQTGSTAEHRWPRRPVPDELAREYRAQGWWNDDSLGMIVAEGLGRMGKVGFRVRSKVRPWEGTFADVDRAARSLAADVPARGV